MRWHFIWDDLKEKPLHYLGMFLQLLAATLLFTIIFLLLFHMQEYKQKIEALNHYEQLYYLKDITDEAYFETNIFSNPDAGNRMYQLYNYIMQNPGFQAYTFYQYQENLQGNASPTTFFYADTSFWNTFRLEAEGGYNLFSNNTPRGYLPVILGHHFKQTYQIGDIINDKYEVMDYLKEGSFYLNPKASSEIISLDESILCPVNIHANSDFSDLDMAINSTVILTNKDTVFQEIQNKSYELGLFTFAFESFSDQLENITEANEFFIELATTILILLLSVSVLGLVSSILEYIDCHKREFLIHIMYGATMKDILIRILSQVFIPLAISILISFAIGKDLRIFLLTTLFILVLGMVISFVPCIRLIHLDLNSAIRKE